MNRDERKELVEAQLRIIADAQLSIMQVMNALENRLEITVGSLKRMREERDTLKAFLEDE